MRRFRTWLAAGCLVAALPFIAAPEELARKDDIDWAKEREFWAFRVPTAQVRPVVKNTRWPKQTVDYFVLARLEQKRLLPSVEAERRTLIRRVTFDLTGLPPTPDEVETFLKDGRDDAYERLVERLLASPRFGERMASLWLPLARYAEDQAHQVGADTKFFYPNAHKYRDWVIGAFNRDLPYEQFVRLQLAADKLLLIQTLASNRSTESKSAAVAGTGSSSEEGEPRVDADKSSTPRAEACEVPEDLAALGFLGLGPKYYNRNRLDVMADEWEDRVDTVTRSFLGLTVACSRCHDHKFEPVTTEDYYALAGVFASTRMVNRMPSGKIEKGDVKAEQMNPGTLHVVEDGAVTNLTVFIRGNVERKGPLVERRFLRVLSEGEPQPFRDGSGRRELAEAIACRSNPLTARVMVNRLWGLFFGRPLVATPSNFGHSGTLPTHPELLDDLAVRFMARGWSIKSLVREMVLSSTYRQTSAAADVRRPTSKTGVRYPPSSEIEPSFLDSAAVMQPADPANELLWRMNRRRLTVEQWRDAVLFVSGNLMWSAGKSMDLNDPTNHLRTVYGRVSRLKLNDLLMQFDYPDANVHAEKRSITTTATQKLFVLNSPFMLSQAQALAARLTADPKETDPARVRRAYQLVFSREPEKSDLDAALKFLAKPDTGELSRWQQYAQILLASNEMLYVD
jgi:hypothetical protein